MRSSRKAAGTYTAANPIRERFVTAKGDAGSAEIFQAKLHGEASDAIGSVSATALGNAAIALSKGGARKTYEHTDPNEDAAAFAIGPAGVVVAVADGHSGRDAARLAIDRLMGGPAERWTGQDAANFQQNWAAWACDEIFAIQNAILAAVTAGALDTARTTLAIAVVRPGDDCIAFASVGDSHIFRVNDVESFDLGYHAASRNRFLGRPLRYSRDAVPNVSDRGRAAGLDARDRARHRWDFRTRNRRRSAGDYCVRMCIERAAK